MTYSNENYTVAAIPGATYNWSVSGGTLQSGQGTNTIGVYFSGASGSTANISVQVNHPILNCSGSGNLTVSIKRPFSITPIWNTRCMGDTITYNISTTAPAASSSTWNWTVTNGQIISGTNTNQIQVVWASSNPGYIEASPASNLWCNTTASYDIPLQSPPNATVFIGPTEACMGGIANINVLPGTQYTWQVNGASIIAGGNSGEVFVSLDINNPGPVEVIVENAILSYPYCSRLDTFTIDVISPIMPAITGSTTVCPNTSTIYSIPSNPNGSYQWSVVGGTIASGAGTNNITVVWGQGYFGSVHLTNLHCGGQTFEGVDILGTQFPDIEVDDLTCDGSSVTLNVPYSYSNYQWNNSATTQSISVNVAGTYSITTTDQNGCSESASIDVTPIPSFPTPASSIGVSPPPSPTPYALLQLQAPAGMETYQWSNGDEHQTTYAVAAGVFSVTVTDENGCTNTSSVNVTNNGSGLSCSGGSCTATNTGPCAGLTPGFTNTTCNPVEFTNATTGGAIYYLWDFGDEGYAFAQNPMHEFLNPGNYAITLWASTDGICWSSTTQNFNIQSVLDADFEWNEVCFGSPNAFTDLSTSNFPITSWSWNFDDGNISSLQNPFNTFVNQGIYRVSLEITDGICTDTLSQQVEIVELQANFSTAQTCLGNTTLFQDNSQSGEQITSWLWDFGDGNTSHIQHPHHQYASAGNYNVQLDIQDQLGCSATTTIAVSIGVFAPGAIVAGGPTTFCEGDAVTLNAPIGVAYSYLWSNGETTPGVSVTHSGLFNVKVTEASGCTATTSNVTVTVHQNPLSSIGVIGPTTFCLGSYNTQLIGNPQAAGNSFEWIKDGLSHSNSQYLYPYNLSHAGLYELVVTDHNGCIDTSSGVQVTIHSNPPNPNITASGPVTFCDGQSVTLTGPPGYAYHWTTGATTQSVEAFHDDFVTLTITDQNNCSSLDWVNVNVLALPNLTSVPYGCYDVCDGSTITISAPIGMAAYSWSNGATSQSINLAQSGNYSVTVTNSSGCIDSSRVLSINSNAADVELGNDTTICQGATVILDAGGGYVSYLWSNLSTTQTLNVVNSGTYMVSVEDHSGCQAFDTIEVMVNNVSVNVGPDTTLCDGGVVLLDAGAGYASYLWNDGSNQQTLLVTTTGVYQVTVSDANGCSATDDVDITINNLGPNVEVTNDTTICSGNDAQLNIWGALAVTWSPVATLDDPNIFDPIASPLNTTTYHVSFVDINGCSGIEQVTVNVVEPPSGQVSTDTTICLGDSVQLFVQGGVSYSWSPVNSLSCSGCFNPYAFPSATTQYQVIVSNENICPNETLNTTVFVDQFSTNNYDQNYTGSEGDELVLDVPAGFSHYQWLPGEGLSCNDCPDPIFTAGQSTNYTLYIENENGCLNRVTIEVEIEEVCDKLYLPNAFSPNNDGVNDRFKVLNKNEIQLIELKVFDRWGNKVFETTDPEQSWDGSYRGKSGGIAAYTYYAINICEGREIVHRFCSNIVLNSLTCSYASLGSGSRPEAMSTQTTISFLAVSSGCRIPKLLMRNAATNRNLFFKLSFDEDTAHTFAGKYLCTYLCFCIGGPCEL